MAEKNVPCPEQNPYLAPETDEPNQLDQPDLTGLDTEKIRKQYFDDESILLCIGSVYFVIGILAFFAIACVVVVMFLQSTGQLLNRFDGQEVTPEYMIGVAIAYAMIALPGVWIGHGLRNLRNWARQAAEIYPIAFLFTFPLATFIIIPVFIMLFNRKSKYVCTPEYNAVIRATPQIRHRISLVIRILMGFFLVVFLIGACGSVFMRINPRG